MSKRDGQASAPVRDGKASGNRATPERDGQASAPVRDGKTSAHSPAYAVLTLALIVMATSGILLLSECWERYATARYWRRVAQLRERTLEDSAAPDILPRFRDAYAQNPDIVGWIRMDDSSIDYPVMQTPGDPEYYLYRDFDGNPASAGAPFADYRCHVTPAQGFHTIVYAHDRLFLQFNQYGYLPGYFTSHQYLRFDTLTETGQYQVIAAFYLDAGGARLLDPWDPGDPQAYEFYNYLEVDSPEGFRKFVDIIRERQILPSDFRLSPRSRILTLVCCATEFFSDIPGDNGRFVVVAKRVGP